MRAPRHSNPHIMQTHALTQGKTAITHHPPHTTHVSHPENPRAEHGPRESPGRRLHEIGKLCIVSKFAVSKPRSPMQGRCKGRFPTLLVLLVGGVRKVWMWLGGDRSDRIGSWDCGLAGFQGTIDLAAGYIFCLLYLLKDFCFVGERIMESLLF